VSVVPEPVTPVPVADSRPFVSLSTTVMVSPAESASASAMLNPVRAVATPCCTNCAPGTVVTGGALIETAIV
jgi:hypothetical protein